jgi:hypothetical protein
VSVCLYVFHEVTINVTLYSRSQLLYVHFKSRWVISVTWILTASRLLQHCIIIVIKCTIKYTNINQWEADHSGRVVWGRKCLRPLKYWNRDFESRSRHECIYSVFVLYCVGNGFRWADPRSKESYQLSKNHSFRILNGNRLKSLIRQGRRRN